MSTVADQVLCMNIGLSQNQTAAARFEYVPVGHGQLGPKAKICMRTFGGGTCVLTGLCLNDGWSYPGGGRPERALFLGGCDSMEGVDTWVEMAVAGTDGGGGARLISMSSPCSDPRCETRQCLTAMVDSKR